MEDAAPEEGQTPLQTVKRNLGTRSRKREIQVISGSETTMMRGHAAGASMADHPHGPGAAVVHHPLGIMSRVISLRRGGVKSREKSQVMERRGGDLAAGAVPDAGLTTNALKARNGKNEAIMIRKGKVEKR